MVWVRKVNATKQAAMEHWILKGDQMEHDGGEDQQKDGWMEKGGV